MYLVHATKCNRKHNDAREPAHPNCMNNDQSMAIVSAVMVVKSRIRTILFLYISPARFLVKACSEQEGEQCNPAAAQTGSILLPRLSTCNAVLRVKTFYLLLSRYHIITILTCPLFTKPFVKSCKKNFRIPSLNIC